MGSIEEAFEEFWKVKPKRSGSNPREQARLKFMRAVASGVDPQKIIGAAREWARVEPKPGTEFVPMAVTWLNQKRYEDYVIRPKETEMPMQFFVRMDTPEWDRWQKWLKANGKPAGSPYSPRDNGWWFPSPLPPETLGE